MEAASRPLAFCHILKVFSSLSLPLAVYLSSSTRFGYRADSVDRFQHKTWSNWGNTKVQLKSALVKCGKFGKWGKAMQCLTIKAILKIVLIAKRLAPNIGNRSSSQPLERIKCRRGAARFSSMTNKRRRRSCRVLVTAAYSFALKGLARMGCSAMIKRSGV